MEWHGQVQSATYYAAVKGKFEWTFFTNFPWERNEDEEDGSSDSSDDDDDDESDEENQGAEEASLHEPWCYLADTISAWFCGWLTIWVAFKNQVTANLFHLLWVSTYFRIYS